MKRFALFDFDKTLYDGFSLLALIDAQITAGLLAQSVDDEVRRSLKAHENGEIDYETMAQQHLDTYAAGLRGKTYDEAFQTALDYFRQTDRLFPFAKPVIELLSETHQTALVTAMPEPGAKAAAAAVGVETVYSTTLEVTDSKLTGNVAESLAGRQGKHRCVQRIEHEHSMADSFVFGDSEGDIEMLRAATHPICINPSEGLRTEAEANGWHICTPEQVEPTVRRLLAAM